MEKPVILSLTEWNCHANLQQFVGILDHSFPSSLSPFFPSNTFPQITTIV